LFFEYPLILGSTWTAQQERANLKARQKHGDQAGQDKKCAVRQTENAAGC
jgi:hypothetical protein